MAQLRTSYCRACGAEIMFIRTMNGKTTPVDAEVVYFKVKEDGPEFYVLGNGTTKRGNRCSKYEADASGYISHFATCPNAEEFKRHGKKARKEAAK